MVIRTQPLAATRNLLSIKHAFWEYSQNSVPSLEEEMMEIVNKPPKKQHMANNDLASKLHHGKKRKASSEEKPYSFFEVHKLHRKRTKLAQFPQLPSLKPCLQLAPTCMQLVKSPKLVSGIDRRSKFLE
jgi:hypothetical protein